MPIMDGWETTSTLKSMMNSKIIPFIPIVGLTAFTCSKDIEKCLAVGMVKVLHKPLNVARF
jgi:CheY-like chemotaxis protein